jgi:elongation factor Ts
MSASSRFLKSSLASIRPTSLRPTGAAKTFSTTSVRLNNNSNSPIKVPINLIAELRKQNPISLSKAREALAASHLSVPDALEWLEKDLEASGAKKAAKVGSRVTKEGLIAVTVMGTRAAMVELRCETDFVGKNEIFRTLAENICSTAAFLDVQSVGGGQQQQQQHQYPAGDPLASFPIDELLQAPVIPLDPAAGLLSSSSSSSSSSGSSSSSHHQNITQAITSAITHTGENIQLQRAVSFSSPIPSSDAHGAGGGPTTTQPFLLPGVYVHGAVKPGGNEGKVGALIILSTLSTDKSSPSVMDRLASTPSLSGDLQKMARAVARQVVGFPTRGVQHTGGQPVVLEEGEVSPYLMDQPFMMYQGEQRTVKEVLAEWARERDIKVDVAAIRRWSVGDEEEMDGVIAQWPAWSREGGAFSEGTCIIINPIIQLLKRFSQTTEERIIIRRQHTLLATRTAYPIPSHFNSRWSASEMTCLVSSSKSK